jgi:hypothetical protein
MTNRTWIKKELLIPHPQARAARLVVLSDAPFEDLINGIAQNLREGIPSWIALEYAHAN